MQEFDENGIPTLEFLRSKGRERLLTYFLGTNVKPPDDYEEMVQAARRLCIEDVAKYGNWSEALANEPLTPMEDVLRELGIDPEEPANEPAA